MTLGGTSAENAGDAGDKTDTGDGREIVEVSGALGSSDASLGRMECRGWSAKTPCPRVWQRIPHAGFLLEKC